MPACLYAARTPCSSFLFFRPVQGRGAVLDTLSEITERHEAIKSLERSLLELHQIFLDMAVLVEAQGEVLDNIETHVAKSVDYVQQGAQYLHQTKEYQKSTRKCAFCGLLIVILIGRWPGSRLAFGGLPR